MRLLTALIIVVLLSANCANLSKLTKSKTLNDLLEHKVDNKSYELGWLNDSEFKAPMFRDFKILDKEITTDPTIDSTSIFHEANQPQKEGLQITSNTLRIDSENKRFEFNGQLIGNWDNTEPHEFDIIVGHRNDTTSTVTFMVSSHIDNYYHGKKIEENIDFEVPSFYISNSKEFFVTEKENEKRKEMTFTINCNIDEHSILIFSLPNRYVEIFEIGKLLVQ